MGLLLCPQVSPLFSQWGRSWLSRWHRVRFYRHTLTSDLSSEMGKCFHNWERHAELGGRSSGYYTKPLGSSLQPLSPCVLCCQMSGSVIQCVFYLSHCQKATWFKLKKKNGHTKYTEKKAYLKVGLSSLICLAVFTGSFKRKLFS